MKFTFTRRALVIGAAALVAAGAAYAQSQSFFRIGTGELSDSMTFDHLSGQ